MSEYYSGNYYEYGLPERRNWLEPSEPEAIGYCAKCREDIFEGEEIWEINGKWYCEYCIDGFRKEAEKEEYFDAI